MRWKTAPLSSFVVPSYHSSLITHHSLEVDRERWRQIDGIFKAALELTEGERAAFVSRACGGDEELRA
jgi:hypothetical protein